MDNTVLISSIVSLIVACVSAVLTVKLTLRGERKKELYGIQRTLYEEALLEVIRIEKNYNLIFNSDVVIRLEGIYIRMRIYAEDSICETFSSLYSEILSKFNSYQEHFSLEDNDLYGDTSFDEYFPIDIYQELTEKEEEETALRLILEMKELSKIKSLIKQLEEEIKNTLKSV